MTLVERCERIAMKAHKGQTEPYTGAPYTTHLRRVAALVTGNDEKAVAWLHDTLEDTGLTPMGLIVADVPAHIIDAVEVLTRYRPTSYVDYISNVVRSGNVLALRVKQADLLDHLRPGCPEHLRTRYEAALPKIQAALTEAA